MEEPRRLGGRYELGGVLGRGGMAEVYLGHDTRLGRSVAVKTLRADMARDPSFQARFRREAQSAASLNHPAIVAVYDTGEDYIDGISIPYIVMEYVEGSTLRELLHSGRRLLPERALEMTIGILQALEYSHRAGIVHRDIKPANVMLTRQGNVKVMDFGIARAMGDAGMTMTQTSAVIGTAQYLSPEQAKGEQVDARSDLYSTGCLLYELLTVRPPFVGDSPVAVAYQHVREEPQPPSVFDPEVRPEVDAIVLKALAKDRDYRYQTADEMRDDIERFLDGLPVAAAQQAAAYGMGAAYGYDQNGYPQQHDPYGQTNVLPQQAPGGPTTVLPQASPAGYPGQPQAGGYDDGYGQTYAGAPGGGNDGYDEGYGRAGRRGEEPPKKSNTSWIVLAVAAVLVLVGTFFVAQAMFGNKGGGTKEAPQVAVPNLVGKTLADAKTLATQAGPKLVVTEGEKIACPDTNVKKDQVCTQNPAAGGQVAETATITVQLSSGPAKATVPGVVGKTKDQALKALADAGFTNVTTDYKDDDNAPLDQVIAQDPANGGADPAAPVKLTVSQGKAKINVPSVVGQQKEAAQAALEAAGFQVDASKTAQTTDPAKVNTVASQNPSGGKQPANTKITLTIFKAPEKVSVPPLQNVPLKDAIAKLESMGLKYSVTGGPQDPNAIVLASNPPAGTQVDPNTSVGLMTKAVDPPKGGDTPTVPGIPGFPNPTNTKGGPNNN
ncbi:Stk1 family PASTA domain-containing Ser/Thr kinase [Kitasatospora sp. NPDC057692]|uniref:Stk1 family PASTA domain-containing Ser/Thr kinase n=1 Tax=Kitasatospora sp. NPDC057692 TaxID=3346215 RepID=UPI0036B013C4